MLDVETDNAVVQQEDAPSGPATIKVQRKGALQPAPPADAELSSLSEEELEELKAEIVDEIVNKVAGEDGERLMEFTEPELITAPYDPRFPNRNQARHCFVRFNEYYKCVYERGEEHQRCQFYQKAYQSLCPSDWLEAWSELREKGLWTGKY